MTPTRVIATGPAWKARLLRPPVLAQPEKRSFAARRIIIADLRGEPTAWMNPGFDDSSWPAATVIAAHPSPERPALRIAHLVLL